MPCSRQVTIKLWMMPTCLAPSSVQQKSHDFLPIGIASHHARAMHWQDTDWEAIVSLYDTLILIRPSPIVALNRAIAVAQQLGPERGIIEVLAIRDFERLAAYPFYFATLGELELRRGRVESARAHFRAALDLARNPMERRFLEQRIAAP
jgi:predicted RNA polymerase sigma factor